MNNELHEVQVDGLPGPTHHFGGLSPGNLASQEHSGFRSSPRAAALQCLAKMRLVLDLGVPQAWLPPLLRPDLNFLRACGFQGDDRSVLSAAQADPQLLHIACSSAFMWTANCATVIPETDSQNGHCHIVLANLMAMSHRATEAAQRYHQWAWLSKHCSPLQLHAALPAVSALGDEGAANHSRIVCDGVVTHLFVHGRSAAQPTTTHFPARQTREASAAVARLAGLHADNLLHVRQSARAIDAGAFHNDVVMVGTNGHVLVHANAWEDQRAILAHLRKRHPSLRIAEINENELSLSESVTTYLFNSQLLATQKGMVLIAPQQTASGSAAAIIERLLHDGFITAIHHLNLQESMANGGGPACLRLRLPVSSSTLAQLPRGFLLDHERVDRLVAVVERLYPTTLTASDLTDPALLATAQAIDAELAALFMS